MRIGIYGGSFDPIHFGHLLLAESCREALQLDQVIFIPANISPLKTGITPTSPKHRIEMLQLALLSNPAFQIDTREVDRGGVSFTVDTLRELRAERPSDQLYLMMGADSLADFDRWREPGAICQLAMPVVVARPGQGEPPWHVLASYMSEQAVNEAKSLMVRMPLIEISSTDLRKRVQLGQSVRYRVPPAVEAYIKAQALYQTASI
jgi:nicotinate-nucleotide adenylyltransferase